MIIHAAMGVNLSSFVFYVPIIETTFTFPKVMQIDWGREDAIMQVCKAVAHQVNEAANKMVYLVDPPTSETRKNEKYKDFEIILIHVDFDLLENKTPTKRANEVQLAEEIQRLEELVSVFYEWHPKFDPDTRNLFDGALRCWRESITLRAEATYGKKVVDVSSLVTEEITLVKKDPPLKFDEKTAIGYFKEMWDHLIPTTKTVASELTARHPTFLTKSFEACKELPANHYILAWVKIGDVEGKGRSIWKKTTDGSCYIILIEEAKFPEAAINDHAISWWVLKLDEEKTVYTQQCSLEEVCVAIFNK